MPPIHFVLDAVTRGTKDYGTAHVWTVEGGLRRVEGGQDKRQHKFNPKQNLLQLLTLSKK